MDDKENLERLSTNARPDSEVVRQINEETDWIKEDGPHRDHVVGEYVETMIPRGFGGPFVQGAFDALKADVPVRDGIGGPIVGSAQLEQDDESNVGAKINLLDPELLERIKRFDKNLPKSDAVVTAWIESGQRLPYSRFSPESAGVVLNERYSPSLITVQTLFERLAVELSKFVPNNENFLGAMNNLEHAAHDMHTAIELDDRRKRAVAKQQTTPQFSARRIPFTEGI